MVLSNAPTPNTKYPTLRGTEVDIRKIIPPSNVEAVRLSHILFASEDLARESLQNLKSANTQFEELARLLSNCELTREKGGEIGWINTNIIATDTTVAVDGNDDDDDYLNELLPRDARIQLLEQYLKPGDVIMLETVRGHHLIKIQDVMLNVRKLASKRNRKSVPTFDLRDKTYVIETMGCQMNTSDSERIEGQLISLGMRALDETKGESKSQADVVLLNTCSIRDHAEQKVYSYIGPHAKRKREGEEVMIIVAGCVAQQEGEQLLRRAPEVDLVMGPQYANRISDLLEDVSNGNQVVATEASHVMEDSTKPRRGSTVAAWVNVIYGCNERCTYCIVPTTRGVEQSRPVESILQEVQELVHDGYKEVTLLGQNIDAYGRDMVPKRKFSDLLRAVGSVPGLKRLRFVTSHPKYMSMGVVDAVAETPAACLNFHVPFQSGSNEVLHNMGRGYTREKFLKIVDRIRSKLPDASITADVIVGFPGETEEQFQETLDLMNEVVFDSINTAAYSPRPNTPAADWENQIADDVKGDRLRRINVLNLEHAAKRRARMLGRTVEILVEERNVKVPTQVMGRTTHGYLVYCDGDIDELRGKLVHVEIEKCQTYYLAGSIVDAPPDDDDGSLP